MGQIRRATWAVICAMMRAGSLAEVCRELFDHYPLAAETADGGGTVRTMLLMLQDSDEAGYFVLSHDGRHDGPPYSLRRRRTTNSVDIGADDGASIPEAVVDVVTRGVPIPRDGSLFGWRRGGDVASLVPVYTTSTPESPDPFWVVMPRAGLPEAQWPPFTGKCLFGDWFWEYYLTREIVSLGDLIAEAQNTVFWANTKAILGADCCAVARDIESSAGYTLRRGVYVQHQALQAGKPVPSLGAVLADRSKIDLAPRLRRLAQSDRQPQGHR